MQNCPRVDGYAEEHMHRPAHYSKAAYNASMRYTTRGILTLTSLVCLGLASALADPPWNDRFLAVVLFIGLFYPVVRAYDFIISRSHLLRSAFQQRRNARRQIRRNTIRLLYSMYERKSPDQPTDVVFSDEPIDSCRTSDDEGMSKPY